MELFLVICFIDDINALMDNIIANICSITGKYKVIGRYKVFSLSTKS